MTAWPTRGWRRLTTIDAHTGGEPLRIITGGFPDLAGDTILALRRDARLHYDDLRRILMWEPRGHADMYGCILTPPPTPDGDVGVLFLHNEGFSTMCGHGIIGLVTAGLDCELFSPRDPAAIRIDTPAGRVVAHAHLSGGRVERVSFRNVPSFVLASEQTIEVPGLGTITCDIAFGGAFYAYVDADALGLTLATDHYRSIIDTGMRIKRAVKETTPIVHPNGDPDLDFLYGVIFVSMRAPGVHSRNVCVFADGEVDRCPTGTGVSGRAAIHHAHGELAVRTPIVIESIIGSRFDVQIVEETRVGTLDAIIPEVTGSAHITGRHEFVIDPTDPLGGGFLLR